MTDVFWLVSEELQRCLWSVSEGGIDPITLLTFFVISISRRVPSFISSLCRSKYQFFFLSTSFKAFSLIRDVRFFIRNMFIYYFIIR